MDIISQQKQALEGLLVEHQSVGVVISTHQNVDVVAASLSLQLILQDSGKSSQIVSSKEPIVEYSSLVGVDQITKNFGGVVKTLTVSFPYKEGEIEKVSYNIEGDRLNVNLFGDEAGITIQEKDIKYIKQGSSPSLLFAIGARDISEIQEFVTNGAKIVNIDNDVANTLYGDVVLVDSSFSSVSEVVTKLAIALGLQIEFDVAQNLLDGISFATQNFSSPKTSPAAFESTSALLQKGAVRRTMKDTRPSSSDTSLSMLNKNQGKQMVSQKPSSNQTQNVGSQQIQSQKPSFSIPATQGRAQAPQAVQEDFGQEEVQEVPTQQIQTPVQTPMQRHSAPIPEQYPAEDNTVSGAEEIPTEAEAPSDWFVPKVFKSTKN